MKRKIESVHHMMPKSLGGSDKQVNLRMLDDNFHKAFHRVFENKSPVGQIAMIANLNAPVFTLDFCMRVNELLRIGRDLDYVYKRGVLIPKEDFLNNR